MDPKYKGQTDIIEQKHCDNWLGEPELLAGCEVAAAPLRVALLLSGGVDSSVALRLLKAAGHQVTAFYLQIWFQEDFRNFWSACPWEDDLQYCQQVCDQVAVELRMVPLTDEYWDRVVQHSIAEIKAGRTPNPDILCNSRVKFGAFYEYLECEHGHAFDRVASGHYARLERGARPDQPVSLVMTPDAIKDQTYFLAHLTQAQLARVMFPLGPLTKDKVRQLAVAAGLPNQARKDSQGICFLGKVKFSEFVREHLGEWPGPLVDEETGAVLGYHQGFWFHTVGQRKGIHLHGGPWYVSRKDIDTNTVFVSRDYHEEGKLRNSFRCTNFNWVSGQGPLPAEGSMQLQCKVRHGPKLYACTLTLDADGADGKVVLRGNDQGLAAGQFAVFYQNSVCIGSAVIVSAASVAVVQSDWAVSGMQLA
ncbi:hypothetical protein WJX72_000616 [[Myrmecia] bisecta]|uniref:tRNA-5-taurinomethyluridine 2-sulfurtransferase n=1 Tax=[Myrmecia] bisecta TaxID=41462 RepID=A0AAW1PS15_9CHLO